MPCNLAYDLLTLFILIFSQAALSQEKVSECQIAFTSEHYVLNVSDHEANGALITGITEDSQLISLE